jgi:hypothetical protein
VNEGGRVSRSSNLDVNYMKKGLTSSSFNINYMPVNQIVYMDYQVQGVTCTVEGRGEGE